MGQTRQSEVGVPQAGESGGEGTFGTPALLCMRSRGSPGISGHSSFPSPLQEYPLAALAGTACHCGFPTTRFPLHEREDEQLCAQKCSAEEFESCGTPRYFIVYQTQVQGKPGLPQRNPPPEAL